MRTKIASVIVALVLSMLSLPTAAFYGAEVMGTGGAATAVATGVSAIFWNPAGLAFSTGNSLSVTYSYPKADYRSSIGIASQFGDLGLGFARHRWPFWGENADWNSVALGYKWRPNFALGVAGRFCESQFSGDLAIQYRQDLVRAGILVQNAFQPNKVNIQPSLALETERITMGLDVYLANNLPYIFRLQSAPYNHQVGVEYRPLGQAGFLALRGGFYQGTVTAGIGVKKQGFFLDFAVIPDWQLAQITTGVSF